VRRGEYSSILDHEFEWLTYLDRKIFSRKCIYKTSSMYGREITSFSKNLTNRKSSTLILDRGIIPSIATNRLNRTEHQLRSITRLDRYTLRCVHKFSKRSLNCDIFWGSIFKRVNKCLELFFWNISKMIVFDHMDSTMKELKTNTEGREAKIRGLNENRD
jgi:hypothetical protein